MTSQNSCDANVAGLKGGKAPLWPDGCSVCELVSVAIRRSPGCLEREQEEERDQQREDAERFGHGEAENQVAELALGRGGIAHSSGEIVAEDDAHARARATHANAGNSSANVLRGNRIHVTNSFLRLVVRPVQWPGGG